MLSSQILLTLNTRDTSHRPIKHWTLWHMWINSSTNYILALLIMNYKQNQLWSGKLLAIVWTANSWITFQCVKKANCWWGLTLCSG